MVYSPDGTKIASGSRDKALKIWNAQTGQCVLTLRGHSDTVHGVCFSPDGSKIASCSAADKFVKIWNVITNKWSLKNIWQTTTMTGTCQSTLSVDTHVPVDVSQILMLLSQLPLANFVPSGLKETLET